MSLWTRTTIRYIARCECGTEWKTDGGDACPSCGSNRKEPVAVLGLGFHDGNTDKEGRKR